MADLVHLIIPKSLHYGQIENPYEVSKISAVVADMTDQAIYEAIITYAKNEGVTDLYLMDKQFVMDAIKEKLERLKEVK